MKFSATSIFVNPKFLTGDEIMTFTISDKIIDTFYILSRVNNELLEMSINKISYSEHMLIDVCPLWLKIAPAKLTSTVSYDILNISRNDIVNVVSTYYNVKDVCNDKYLMEKKLQ